MLCYASDWRRFESDALRIPESKTYTDARMLSLVRKRENINILRLRFLFESRDIIQIPFPLCPDISVLFQTTVLSGRPAQTYTMPECAIYLHLPLKFSINERKLNGYFNAFTRVIKEISIYIIFNIRTLERFACLEAMYTDNPFSHGRQCRHYIPCVPVLDEYSEFMCWYKITCELTNI